MSCLKLRQVLWRLEGAQAAWKGCASSGKETLYFEHGHNVCRPKSSNSRLFTSCRPSPNINQILLKTKKIDMIGANTSSRTFSKTEVLLNTPNGIEESELKKEIENITDKFMEARELMEDARESKGTTYFSEDVEEAQQAVKETLDSYQQLLAKISQSQKQQVMRTIGLKMEELKAQLNAMEEDLKEDH